MAVLEADLERAVAGNARVVDALIRTAQVAKELGS
jgi:hypothetical protein